MPGTVCCRMIGSVRLASSSLYSEGLTDIYTPVDHSDQRLLEREAEFCSYRGLKVISCSWNIDAAKPADLSSTTENASFLANVLMSEESPDIVVFGFQEIIPLEDKKLAAS